MYSHYINVIIL